MTNDARKRNNTNRKSSSKKASKKSTSESQVASPSSNLDEAEEERGHENEAPGVDSHDQVEMKAEAKKESSNRSELTIKLSQRLMEKIKRQAEEEGISIEDLVQEFLAEAVTLRAWEIVEKKGLMRMGTTAVPQMNRNSGRGQRKGKHGMSQGRYQSIMDDKANFIEYVRNQERNRR